MPSTIDGIVSNLNTTEIVESIINAERHQVNHLMQRQAEATNQLTTYNAISALVVALQTSIAPLLKPSTFDAATLSVSNTDALTATATGQVTPGSYAISVDALATNHQIASQGFDDPTTLVGTGTFQISVGSSTSHTITVDSSNNTLSGLKDAINDAGIGVTASIIHDGSLENPYRLLLSSNSTGTANTLTVAGSLTGGAAPNFATASFDTVEASTLNGSTSAVTLGTGASYSGSSNKKYTFTVGGSGTQTVGTDTITINWTDGTNSGSFDVTTADTEVALTGTGAEGLTLSFAAGTLVAGETFSVQGFTPLVQGASDARVSIGSGAGGGSPIQITSSSNTLTGLIGGVTLNLKTTTTSAVTVEAAVDNDTIKSRIQDMLAKYTEVMAAIDEQFSYNPDTEEGGTLLGDSFLLTLQSGLRAPLSGALDDLNLSLKTLRSVGIHTIDTGAMGLVDSGKLFAALADDPAAVAALFTDSATIDSSLIRFLSAGTTAAESTTGYAIDITQAATQASLRGLEIDDPASQPLTITAENDSFILDVDGAISKTISIAQKTYSSGAQLAAEIQSKITGDSMVGGRGVTVTWTDLGTTGYLTFTTGTYGSTSRVATRAPETGSTLATLGFGSGGFATAGQDVAGTINGETATGSGRILTGASDAATTAGISLEVKLTTADLKVGTDATITFNRGFASRLNRVADAIGRATDGSIARRTKGLDAQIEDLKAQIADQEERLAIRRDKLFERFIRLESALSEFQTQGAFLSSQLAQLSANTYAITSRR